MNNEKYKENALLQKNYTADFLTNKRVENNGEVQKYYVEESHPSIIDKEMWEAVQLEMERRRVFAETYGVYKLDYATLDNPFTGRGICGRCGSQFGRKTWHSINESLKRKVWMCNNRYKLKGEKGCTNKHIDDKILYQVFINVFNLIIENKDYFMEKWKDGLKSENVLIKYRSKQFIKIIEKAEDVNLFLRIIEKMTVFKGKKIIVGLLDRTEIEVVIE